ncbi:hypothetical protein [Vibrio parahaemolyticus]|uniref:hypothetical protein n=1 Tax=Vibrio parahaemolyticus TaxID=670 RepID=UPI002879A64B|nr:hypothetical protein [Vibrio parahaemolyticus]MDS1911103.1 hypothetical protein [Vibrio parahaemolyticus]
MTKEMDDFRDWVNFKNQKMTRWVTDYFVKKGITRRLPSIEDITTCSQEKGILEQAEHYFSSMRDQVSKQEKLSKMKKSWAQYSRRKKGTKRVHTVYVDDSTHKVLESIKKKKGLDNLGQSVESIINGTAFRREILRLEKDNYSLNEKLENFSLLKAKYRQQRDQLEEIRNKVDSLEERNLMLTKALEQLTNSL